MSINILLDSLYFGAIQYDEMFNIIPAGNGWKIKIVDGPDGWKIL